MESLRFYKYRKNSILTISCFISYTRERFFQLTQTPNTFSIDINIVCEVDFRVKWQRLPSLELAEILTRHLLKIILFHLYHSFIKTNHVSGFSIEICIK